MTDEVSPLVFVLPVQKRPALSTYYGRREDNDPVCVVHPDGRVFMFAGATVNEVERVLTSLPFNIAWEDLDLFRKSPIKDEQWILVVFNEDTEEVHVHCGPEGPWETQEHANRATERFIAQYEGDSSALRLTITTLEKYA